MSVDTPAKTARLAAVAKQYRDGFEEIRRMLVLHEGFVLVPLQCPGSEVAIALARELDASGFTTRTVMPRGRDWEQVAEHLLEAPEALRGVVTLVFGAERATRSLLHGLGVLNQKRDLLPGILGGPLLWCGTEAFLDASWEAMPDVWSVRALTVRLEPSQDRDRLARDDAPALRAWFQRSRSDPDAAERLRVLRNAARKQGDWRSAADLGLRYAEALEAEDRLEDAEQAVRFVRTISPSGTNVRLVARAALELARILLLRGDPAGAQRALSGLRGRGLGAAAADLDVSLEVERRLVEAAIAVCRGRLVRAEELLRGALKLAAALDDEMSQGRVRFALGDVLARREQLEEATAMVARAGQHFRAAENLGAEARTLGIQGDLATRQQRTDEAEWAFTLSRSLHQDLGEKELEQAADSRLSAIDELTSEVPRAARASRARIWLDQEGMRRARRHLAERVCDPEEIRLLATDAGLRPERIVWRGSAEQVWFDVLDEARRHGPETVARLFEEIVWRYPVLKSQLFPR